MSEIGFETDKLKQLRGWANHLRQAELRQAEFAVGLADSLAEYATAWQAERLTLKTRVAELEAAKSALVDAYIAAVGDAPIWSSRFGAEEVASSIKERLAELERWVEANDKVIDNLRVERDALREVLTTLLREHDTAPDAKGSDAWDAARKLLEGK